MFRLQFQPKSKNLITSIKTDCNEIRKAYEKYIFRIVYRINKRTLDPYSSHWLVVVVTEVLFRNILLNIVSGLSCVCIWTSIRNDIMKFFRFNLIIRNLSFLFWYFFRYRQHKIPPSNSFRMSAEF